MEGRTEARPGDKAKQQQKQYFIRALVGTDTGPFKILKLIGPSQQRLAERNELEVQYGGQSRDKEIEQLCTSMDEKEVYLGRKDGTIESIILGQGKLGHKAVDTAKKGRLVGLQSFRTADRLISCSRDSNVVRLWTPAPSPTTTPTTIGNGVASSDEEEEGEDKDKDKEEEEEQQQPSAVVAPVGPGILSNDYTANVGKGPIDAIRITPDDKGFAWGGKENELKIWDIETQTTTWQSKNVRHDFLDMRVPVWVKAIDYIPEEPHKVVIGTALGQLRIYDIRSTRRRPVVDTTITENPITCLRVNPNGRCVAAGNVTGRLVEAELRMGRVSGSFKGAAGSISGIYYHPTLPIFASSSIDRFVRFYNSNTHKLLAKVYLKQRLNAVALLTNLEEYGTPATDTNGAATPTTATTTTTTTTTTTATTEGGSVGAGGTKRKLRATPSSASSDDVDLNKNDVDTKDKKKKIAFKRRKKIYK
eukprot:TRINITY_DN899_c0_g1_i1.p1 TRINITY_DN899_c0_g1~~TRINITY_DN899_c0_g1_i1.p1  ORF type:complete len:475 (-),score=128.10 TRINITY_DN899_c0_g1_i1:453-1877(-)